MFSFTMFLLGFWIGFILALGSVFMAVKFFGDDDSPLVEDEPVGRYVALKPGQEVVDIQQVCKN